jgi:prolyl-tRNA synthetase
LPFSVYQIQVKFRDELRAKSGLLRTREFLMKDLYSFHASQADADSFYEKVKKSYLKIFKAAGIGESVYVTLASGGSFSKFSHEFQMKTPAGEDIVYVCLKCGIAINREIKDQFMACPECKGKDFKEEKTVEVGNIFKLGIRYSDPFDFSYTDKDGVKKPVIMSCFGIGLPRLMGSIVEKWHDDYGIIWPKTVSPFDIHLLSLLSKDGAKNKKIKAAAKKAYEDLQKKSLEVLFDDRDGLSAGEKFKDCDLIGISERIVISEKTLAAASAEIKKRDSKKTNLVKLAKLAGTKF